MIYKVVIESVIKVIKILHCYGILFLSSNFSKVFTLVEVYHLYHTIVKTMIYKVVITIPTLSHLYHLYHTFQDVKKPSNRIRSPLEGSWSNIMYQPIITIYIIYITKIILSRDSSKFIFRRFSLFLPIYIQPFSTSLYLHI
jgi:hypothetical protein